jgi:hypothetical protein
MEFRRVEVNSQYRSLRLLSVGGLWELGLSPYHHGMRVRMGRVGQLPKLLDCCLGWNKALYGPVMLALIERLDPLGEDALSAQVQAVFPWKGVSPEISGYLPLLLGKADGVNAKNLH